MKTSLIIIAVAMMIIVSCGCEDVDPCPDGCDTPPGMSVAVNEHPMSPDDPTNKDSGPMLFPVERVGISLISGLVSSEEDQVRTKFALFLSDDNYTINNSSFGNISLIISILLWLCP